MKINENSTKCVKNWNVACSIIVITIINSITVLCTCGRMCVYIEYCMQINAKENGIWSRLSTSLTHCRQIFVFFFGFVFTINDVSTLVWDEIETDAVHILSLLMIMIKKIPFASKLIFDKMNKNSIENVCVLFI